LAKFCFVHNDSQSYSEAEMGSFQQIILGAICVGGAFLMGHYLHYQTPPGTPFEGKTATAESDKRIADLKQRRERIAMLPNFRTQTKLAPLFQKEQDLPPPSQLDGMPSSPSPSSPSVSKESTSQLDLADQDLDIEVPDFSELAAQFKGMALKLPDLNSAPSNAVDKGSVTQLPQANLPQATSTSEVVNPAPSNAEPFGSAPNGSAPIDSAQNGLAQNGLAPNAISGSDQRSNPHLPANEAAVVPNFHTPINPVEELIQAERDASPRINPVPESTETSFRPEDFAPRLRADISGSEIQPVNLNPESATESSVTDLSEVSPFPVSNSILETSPSVLQAPHPKAVISYNDPFPDKFENRTEAGRPNSSLNPPTEIGSGLEPKQSPASNSGPTLSGQTLGWDKHNPTPVDHRETKSVLGQPANSAASTEAKVRAGGQIPFGLNELERSRLSRLNFDSPQSNTVQATRFEEYRTEMGDTLTSIASKFYGKPEYYLDIYLANRNQLRTPAQVPAGIILKLPVYE
jgi:phage tail protein X